MAILYINFLALENRRTHLTLDLNLPLTGIAFGLVFKFLSVHHPEGSVRSKIARVDWVLSFPMSFHFH